MTKNRQKMTKNTKKKTKHDKINDNKRQKWS